MYSPSDPLIQNNFKKLTYSSMSSIVNSRPKCGTKSSDTICKDYPYNTNATSEISIKCKKI